ncbi:hypothetical protein EZV62_009056 [Acer yangbiense]|uniref:Exostosin GT47 domain-containing protein n=1 Tax=Acer yangbiense TaxID=1000413 RepID=A0A5C7IF83_9ROSI|nr:hypothetical protein EZV62_009056 [Acer yangbiense]
MPTLLKDSTQARMSHFQDSILPENLGAFSEASHCSILAFFAGVEHGHIRSLLFQHWKNNKDSNIQVHEYLPAGVSYNSMIRKSKFCLCPNGYEVGTPRIVEAIYAGCSRVLINLIKVDVVCQSSSTSVNHAVVVFNVSGAAVVFFKVSHVASSSSRSVRRRLQGQSP